jgi:hypothetical protein
MLSLQSRIRIPEDVLFHDLDGEALLLNLETNRYYGVDRLGAHIWSLLNENGSVAAAYQAILGAYDVEPERLQADLLALLNKLAEQGLVVVEDSAVVDET